MADLKIEIDDSALNAKDLQQDISIINTLIPDLIKRKTGTVPSIRRIFTAKLPGQQSTLPVSPPPPYAEPQSAGADGTLDKQSFGGILNGVSGARGSKDTIYAIADEGSSSGVRWKHVGKGCRLIEFAGREAAADEEDPELTRKMFIDGVGYLLKALPDLSDDENAQLSAYLPASLQAIDAAQHDQRVQPTLDRKALDQSNWTYQLATKVTMYGVLLVSLLLPIFARFVAVVYRCDQRYNISARMAETTTQTVSSLARRVAESLDEGRGGQVVFGVVLYAIANASKGVVDGYDKAVDRQNSVERANEKSSRVLASRKQDGQNKKDASTADSADAAF